MNRSEIKALIQSVVDDPKYIDTATEIVIQVTRESHLPDLRSFLLDIDAPCMIRLEGCQGKGDQRAHIRKAGMTGTGLKAPDPLFAWSCSNCHIKTESNPAMRPYMYRAIVNTMYHITTKLPIKCANDVTRKKTNKGMK